MIFFIFFQFAHTPVQSLDVQFLHGSKPMGRVSWPPLQPFLKRLLHPPSLQGGPYAPGLSLIPQPPATQTASQSLWFGLFQNGPGMGILHGSLLGLVSLPQQNVSRIHPRSCGHQWLIPFSHCVFCLKGGPVLLSPYPC